MMSEGYKPVNEVSEMIEEKEHDSIENTSKTIERDSSSDDDKPLGEKRIDSKCVGDERDI